MKHTLALAAVILHTTARFRCVGAFATTMKRSSQPPLVRPRGSKRAMTTAGSGPAAPTTTTIGDKKGASTTTTAATSPPPLYLAEGLLAVHKPLTWSSNDVVGYIRGILIRDANDRGLKDNRKRRKVPMMKVGHGGTLDPLASGVLVLGVGGGTTRLQSYLEGGKEYIASCELGYETDTLDAEGKLVKTAPWDHVKSMADVEAIVPKFIGKIEQVPPLYSAIRIDGKRLYELARKDSDKAEKLEIPKREVEVHDLKVGSSLEESVIRSGVVDGPRYREAAKLLEEAAEAAAAAAAAAKVDDADGDAKGDSDDESGNKGKRNRRNKRKQNNNKNKKKNLFNEGTVPSIQLDSGDMELPRFSLSLKCGGGTYVRSLARDMGYELDTVATMTGLVRTRQGPFVLDDALRKDDWTAENIYEAIRSGKGGQ